MTRTKKYLLLSIVVLLQFCHKPENPLDIPLTDIDDNVYATTRIGTQLWMNEDLKVTKLNDGTAIYLVTNPDERYNLNIPAYSTEEPFGHNYNGYVINTGRICPEGWRVPDLDDWDVLRTHLELSGEKFSDGVFGQVSGERNKWWTSSRYGDAGRLFKWFVTVSGSSFTRTFISESSFFPVRCLHVSPVTGNARDIFENSAVLKGVLTGLNEAYFEYGETESYGKKKEAVTDVSSFIPYGVTTQLTDLTPNKFYHFRIVEMIDGQPFYGGDKKFFSSKGGIVFNSQLSYGTVSDVDNNSYRTIKIGDQVWMAENLKTTRYNDGTAIPFVSGAHEWSQLSSAAYCWNDLLENASVYGALYNWYAIENGRICPAGWHVPSDEDWTRLEVYVGSDFLMSKAHKLIEGGSIHWPYFYDKPDLNETGFTALPAGFRQENGIFKVYENTLWWSSTLPTAPDFKNNFGMSKWLFEYDARYSYRASGLSVRCVMD